MKTLFTCIAALFIIAACSNDDDANSPDLLGTWVLTETLVDPGDGSGTFQPAESYRVVTFNDNGTYTASESFCNFYFDYGTGAINGSYTNINIICDTGVSVEMPYVVENGALIISYPCNEICKAKYQRQVP